MSLQQWTPEILTARDIFIAYAEQPENADIYERIKYLDSNTAYDETHITVLVGIRIIGIAGVRQNPNNPDEMWVTHVSVDPDYQGQGIARALIEKVYEFACDKNWKVVPSSFTEAGQRLKPIFARMNQKYTAAATPHPFRDFGS